jgi:TolB-like protein
MRALVPLVLLMSTACASIMRGSKHDVTIYGPEDLKVYDGSRPVDLVREGIEAGQVKYSAAVDRHTASLTLASQDSRAEVPLTDHVAAGWVFLDALVIWPLSLPIDAISGAWKNFDDIKAVGLGQGQAQQAPSPPPPRSTAVQVSARNAEDDRRDEEARRNRGTRRAVVTSGKLAVLDFKNTAKDLSHDDVRYFADVVRGATLKSAPGMEVMTRENLLVLLQSTGKDLGQCEGECEVDTGRRIGADAIISGDVLKVGSKFHISLRLHETHDGRLLSSAIATGRTVDELDETLQAAAADLLTPAR